MYNKLKVTAIVLIAVVAMVTYKHVFDANKQKEKKPSNKEENGDGLN